MLANSRGVGTHITRTKPSTAPVKVGGVGEAIEKPRVRRKRARPPAFPTEQQLGLLRAGALSMKDCGNTGNKIGARYQQRWWSCKDYSLSRGGARGSGGRRWHEQPDRHDARAGTLNENAGRGRARRRSSSVFSMRPALGTPHIVRRSQVMAQGVGHEV